MHRNDSAALQTLKAGGRAGSQAAPLQRVYGHAERMRVIFGIIACILLAALDQTVVLPAIPQMAESLGGASHLSWVVSAYLLTSTATTPIYGKLSDQFGRRAVLVPAIGLFLLASVFCAMGDSVPMLILGRALQGVGGGALMAVSQAAVGDVVPPRERGRYQAWFAGTWAFASIFGPVAGGFITQHLSWRWIFWANLPVGAVAAVLCARGLAGLVPAGLRGKIDYAGAALMVTAVASVLLGLSTGGVDFPWVSGPEGGLFALALGAIGLLIGQQRRAASPLFPPSLLAQSTFRSVLLMSFLNAATMFGSIFLLPLALQWLHHASPAQSGLYVMPYLATTTIGAFTAGQISRATGGVRRIMAGGLMLNAAMLAAVAVIPVSAPLLLPVIATGIAGFGVGCMMPTSIVAAQSQAGRGDIGAATGTLLLSRSMGGAFGATMAGAMLGLAHGNLALGFKLGFVGCAVLSGVAAIIALRMQDVRLSARIEA